MEYWRKCFIKLIYKYKYLKLRNFKQISNELKQVKETKHTFKTTK